MTKIPVLTVLLVCLSSISGVAVMPEADCLALWKKADVNGDGNVAGVEASIYIEAMTAMALKTKDASGEKIEAGEFLKACQLGAFDNIKT